MTGKMQINGCGICQYAAGAFSTVSGHRQYETAIRVSEAGLHQGVAFSFPVEIETNPPQDD
jgi:hypothetical protein